MNAFAAVTSPPAKTVPREGENLLYRHCFEALLAETLELPTLPDISLKIRKAINDSKASNGTIAKVVQLDPVITGRLIQIANSPFYLGHKKIASCPEALTRIGLKATQHFVTSLALKSVFFAESAQIRKRMLALWSHSSYVAAICAVLAYKTRGFDPDQAMLAGLIHDIGVVPILTFADRHPHLLQNPGDLDETIRSLRVEMGVKIVQKWSFPAEFETIVSEAENWYRRHDEPPDYADLVILAQLHSFVGTLHVHQAPRIDETPAYDNLLAHSCRPDISQIVLELAKDEVRQVQQLLGG